MKLKEILKALEKDYGWSFHDEKGKLHLTTMQKEFINDVQRVVKNISSNPDVSGQVCPVCKKGKIVEKIRYNECDKCGTLS